MQILPAVVFFILYALWRGSDPRAFLVDGFGRYRVTIALFEMFVVCFTVSRLLRNHPRAIDLVLVGLVPLMTAGIAEDTRDSVPALGRTLAFFVAPYSGLFVVLAIFYKLRDRFARGGAVSRTLQFVGRRTLDIYLLHYFFISAGMPLSDHPDPIVRTAVIAGYALLIVAGCLVVSRIVRISDLLGHYLFGAPHRTTPRPVLSVAGRFRLRHLLQVSGRQ